MLKKSHKLADKLVLSKLRALLGGRINFMPCGGAKLDETIGRFFHAIGINVKLGYGMTETTATVSCWDDKCFNLIQLVCRCPVRKLRSVRTMRS
ncbi:long-chain-fatty-acid-CoA ligase [Vibrio ponticus]|nr:long-chain-fatty-acid-CoA ligase [Vibrio ponticus]